MTSNKPVINCCIWLVDSFENEWRFVTTCSPTSISYRQLLWYIQYFSKCLWLDNSLHPCVARHFLLSEVLLKCIMLNGVAVLPKCCVFNKPQTTDNAHWNLLSASRSMGMVTHTTQRLHRCCHKWQSQTHRSNWSTR